MNAVQGTGQGCWQTAQNARENIVTLVIGTMPVTHEMFGMW